MNEKYMPLLLVNHMIERFMNFQGQRYINKDRHIFLNAVLLVPDGFKY